MSLQWFLSRTVPADTAQLGRVILRERNLYRQIGDRFDELFPDERAFASMYDAEGRGAIPPLLSSLVTVFQMMEKVPDRLATEYVVTRIDWKYALHLPLTYGGFHFTDLSAYRQRLLEHGAERVLFDQLLVRLKGQGLFKVHGKMRTDSTHLLAVVERLSQYELVAESLRMAVLAVEDTAPQWSEEALPETFLEAYSERQSEYGLSERKVQERLVRAGRDGFWFLAQVDRSAPAVIRQLPEVATLRTVLEQQFPQGSGGPPAAKRPSGRKVIESPHEKEARYSSKRGKGWLGYKVQVTETYDPQLPHLIVDLEATGALDNDSPQLPHIQARLAQRDLLPAEQQVDQGYMSGRNLVESAQLGITLLGVPLADTQGPAGFRQSDFQVDEGAQQATCPAGHTSRLWAKRHLPEVKEPAIQIRFAAQTCQRCPFFGRCTSSPQGRSLTLHPYRAALAARRAQAQNPAFRERLHPRAGIEGTISELVRAYRLRWARYRGMAKVQLQAYFTALAANLKRLVRWWTRPQPDGVPAG